jgi:type I restriction enzyme S subunit
MAGDWETKRIGDLGRVVTGKTPSTAVAENFGGNYPFITIPDMVGRREISSSGRTLSEQGAQTLRSCRLPVGAVMMSCIATIGNCGITTRPSFTNQQINSLICGDDADPKFVYYCFTQLGHALEAAGGGGSVYTNVSKSRFEEIELTLPPLTEQKAIAAVLGALDDKIDLNRQMNATLEAMARALFQSWFVDFDPVRAKMEGRQPAGMDAESAALFPEHFEDSELGEIPRGWEVANLGSVLDTLETGRRPKGGVSGYSFGVPSVGAESINGIGVFDFSKTKFIPREFYEKTASGRVKDLDVLLYKDGGKPGEFRPRVGLFGYGFPFDEFCINEHVFRMRAQGVGQHYLYFAVSDERVLLDFANKGGKAAIPGINQTDVRSAQILKPPKAVLAQFEILTQPICQSIIENFAESRTLATLRDTLLPKLLSGEISVPLAEGLVSPAS